MSRQQIHIGLDAGGTKTTLLAKLPTDGPLLSLLGPAANLQRQGKEQTARVLATLIREAMAQQPDAVLGAVCAGVAGAGSTHDQQSLVDAVIDQLGDARPASLRITHDGDIALEGAFEGGSGVVVIAGTGSVLFARTANGELRKAGGWGYLFGDEGSGHMLGIEGLRAVAHAMDGGPATMLQPLLADQCALDSREAIIRRVYREAWSVQQIAPLVIDAAEHDDPVARRIVETQTQALAQQILWLETQSGAIEPRIALLGGLLQSEYYRAALTTAVTSLLPDWQLLAPLHPPVEGALRLALAGQR